MDAAIYQANVGVLPFARAKTYPDVKKSINIISAFDDLWQKENIILRLW